MRLKALGQALLLTSLLLSGGACRFAGVCLQDHCEDEDSADSNLSTDCSEAAIQGLWNMSTSTPHFFFSKTCTFTGTSSNGCEFSGKYQISNGTLASGNFSMNDAVVSSCNNTAIVDGNYACTYTVSYSGTVLDLAQRTRANIRCVLEGDSTEMIPSAEMNFISVDL